MKSLLVFLLFFCCGSILLPAAAVDYQYQLHQYLASLPFDKSLLPVLDPKARIPVNVALYPGHLMALEGAQQVLSLSAYVLVMWPEQRLQWNPADFGGVSSISRLPSEVWYPRLLLYNGVSTNQWLEVKTPITYHSVFPNVTMAQIAMRLLTDTSCEFDMVKFPKDEQTCEIDLMVYDEMGRANVYPTVFPDHNTTNYLGLYQTSNEWDLVEFEQGVTVKKYNMSTAEPLTPIPLMSVKFKYRRESQYYIMNIIIPVLLLTFLQVLVFFVPVESGEKMGLGITILLSFTVFLLLIDSIIPKSKTIPFIGTFITAAMSLSAMSLLLSSLVLRLHFVEASTRMPRAVHLVLIRGLATVMLLRPRESAGSKGGSGDAGGSCSRVAPETEEVKMRKRSLGAGDDEDEQQQQQQQQQQENQWKLAALAVERLMVVLGMVAIAALIFLFVLPALV